MGKVFTAEDVSCYYIPKLSSFDQVAERLKTELMAAPSVTAALMLGSFLRGEHNIRSDIDVLVLYSEAMRPETIVLLQKLQKEARALFVPLQFISLHTELAASPHHHVASTFLGHFQIAERQGGHIKGEPLKSMYPRTHFREDVRAYLAHKLRKFEVGEINFDLLSDERRMKLLGDALSFPVYVARMMIQCHEGLGGPMLAGGDSKTRVMQLYPSIVEGSEATSILLEVFTLDHVYTTEITRHQVYPHLTRHCYRKLIERLRPAIGLAWRFAWLNLKLLD